jgi:hypothetical protein
MKTSPSYSTLTQSPIFTEEIGIFFRDELLKEKPVDLQPEVITPEQYPHILPPDNIDINTDIPSEKEIDDARKRFKNGKCQGTDFIYAEELKYNFSKRFMIYMLFLISIIWTSCKVPSCWLISCIYLNI